MLTIYSKPSCPYCVKAKQLLESKGIHFQEVDVSADPQARQRLVDLGLRTVPQIFQGDELYVSGGYEGLANKLQGNL